MHELIINARGLSKAYPGGGQVLNGLDLQVPRGQSLAIMGPSGSGKSTLLNLLNGLLQPDSGDLELFGANTRQLSDAARAQLRRQKIATIFQDNNLIPTLSIARNLAFRARLAGRPDAPYAEELLNTLGIAEVAGRYPDQTSGGQRQRGAIAAAFAMVPELLLADEPTGSLDETNARAVAKLFFDGIRERGLTAILVTHNPNLARQCDLILELSSGVLHPANVAGRPDPLKTATIKTAGHGSA